MIVQINGEARNIVSSNLDALVRELELVPEAVATALNREFVPRPSRAETMLSEGDTVEILSPMQGG